MGREGLLALALKAVYQLDWSGTWELETEMPFWAASLAPRRRDGEHLCLSVRSRVAFFQ
jgi:hypothetical protein